MNNRQAGRRRGRGGQRQGGNPGRPDNGNRIDNRARGNAAQLLEKYKTLAADAQRSGDRVNTEYYLQFADHYFRVLSESRARMEENQPRRQSNDEDDGDDFGFEGELGSPASFGQLTRADTGDDDGDARDDRRPQRREREPRAARSEGDEDRGNARREREPRPARNDGDDDRGTVRREREPRATRNESDEDRGPRRITRAGSHARDDADGEPREARPAPANDEVQDDRPRRGRPRRVQAADEGADVGFDAAVLPPAIAPAAGSDEDDAPAERPRRGRPRRVRTDDEVVPPAA